MSLFSTIQHRWQQRKRFARRRDWLMSLYDVALRLAPRGPLPLRNRVWPIRIQEQSAPLYLRLGRSDGFVLKEIFLTGVYQPTLDALREPVRQIVDLGSNVGFSVRLWLERFPEARVLAVEPDRFNLSTLLSNLRPRGLADRTHLARACVAGKTTTVFLDRSAEDCAIHITDQPVGEPVDARTMPQLLDDAGFAGPIDLVKMDIEGAEADVLADCAAWIGRVELLTIELHGDYTQARLEDDLRRNGGHFQLVHGDVTAGNPLLVYRRT